MLTYEEARQILVYDTETGVLRWKVTMGGRGLAGKEAGSLLTHNKTGKTYRRITVRRKRYKAHRVIYLLQTGAWPPDKIDHQNGDGADNRWENLRAATPEENSRNQRKSCTNMSGQTGVYWHKHHGKWAAQIMVHRRNIHLGYFTSKGDAVAARKKAEVEHGFHPNHGIDRPL